MTRKRAEKTYRYPRCTAIQEVKNLKSTTK